MELSNSVTGVGGAFKQCHRSGWSFQTVSQEWVELSNDVTGVGGALHAHGKYSAYVLPDIGIVLLNPYVTQAT